MSKRKRRNRGRPRPDDDPVKAFDQCLFQLRRSVDTASAEEIAVRIRGIMVLAVAGKFGPEVFTQCMCATADSFAKDYPQLTRAEIVELTEYWAKQACPSRTELMQQRRAEGLSTPENLGLLGN